MSRTFPKEIYSPQSDLLSGFALSSAEHSPGSHANTRWPCFSYFIAVDSAHAVLSCPLYVAAVGMIKSVVLLFRACTKWCCPLEVAGGGGPAPVPRTTRRSLPVFSGKELSMRICGPIHTQQLPMKLLPLPTTCCPTPKWCTANLTTLAADLFIAR